jgi:hypothetical protein
MGSDTFCVRNNKGKPLCAASGACVSCKRDGDCAMAGPGAKCIKKCPICQAQGTKSACVVPFTADKTPARANGGRRLGPASTGGKGAGLIK